jgi:adenylate cyclase
MAVEIERKFLLASDSWRADVASSTPIVQLYLAADDRCQVRVRRYGNDAYLTIKGQRSGASRVEIETAVPAGFVDDVIAATELHVAPAIEKTRHLVPSGDFVYEIDEFAGANAGLVVAEIELPAADTEFPRPEWLGAEVTSDERYANAYLTRFPFTSW